MAKKDKIKVLITAGNLNMGGLENQLVYLGENADKSMFKIDYAATDANAYYKSRILEGGCGFKVLPNPREVGTYRYCKALMRLMKKEQYDVIHAQELFHSGVELFCAFLARIPKRIAHSHSTLDGSKHNGSLKKIYHFAMRRSILLFGTDFLACSTAAGQYLFGRKIVHNNRFKVIFNSVDTMKYLTAQNRQVIDKTEGCKYIAHVGRFADVKNHDFIIDIAGVLKKRGDRIKFVLVGEGELFAHCQNRVMLESLENYVVFLGARSDVANILTEVDAFILPSWYEGMPLSIIEAQAAGLPCLVAEHITDEVDFGLKLIQKCSLQSDAETWRESILKLLTVNHPQRDEIENAIHRKGFDVTDFTNKICGIYKGGET